MLRAFFEIIVTELAGRGWDLNPCLAFTKMSNSFELLRGPIETIQQKYEILSDIVTEYNGKVHGSQSHIISNNSISLIVYYEVLKATEKK